MMTANWRPIDSEPADGSRVWCSDGTEVWLTKAWTDGSLRSSPHRCLYWAPCDFPQPPVLAVPPPVITNKQEWDKLITDIGELRHQLSNVRTQLMAKVQRLREVQARHVNYFTDLIRRSTTQRSAVADSMDGLRALILDRLDTRSIADTVRELSTPVSQLDDFVIYARDSIPPESTPR